MSIALARRDGLTLAFDAIVGGLFGVIVSQSAGPAPNTATEYLTLFQVRLLYWIPTVLDWTITVSAIAAFLCVWRGGQWSAALQRILFYALLIRTAFVFLELTLPSEGGVGGFVLLLVLPFLLALTLGALAAALRTKGTGSG